MRSTPVLDLIISNESFGYDEVAVSILKKRGLKLGKL